MLKLERRCIVADESGRQHEFRVVSALRDGVLLLVPAARAEEIRLQAGVGVSGEVLRALRHHLVALDTKEGLFLTQAQLAVRIEEATNPLIRLVALTA